MFLQPVLLLQATCVLYFVGAQSKVEPLNFLQPLPPRTERQNVKGLQPAVMRLLECCTPSVTEHCAQYPDPWQQCGTASLDERELGALTASLTRFGLDAYRIIAKYNTGANVLISPVSLAVALTHLLLGARNETKRELEEALFYTDGFACVHKTLQQLLMGTESLLSASQLFVRDDFHIQPNFQERSEKFYGGRPQQLSRNASENARMINAWVTEHTGGKITKLVEQVSGDTILMLLNAVFFKGTWKTKFNKEDTKVENFWVTADKKVQVAMLHQSTYPLAVIYDQEMNVRIAKFQMFGGNSLVIIIPQDPNISLSKTERALNFEKLSAIMDKLHKIDYKQTNVMLPKISLNFNQDLLFPFRDMGLQDVLGQPNLCGMSADQRLAISSAEHRAVLAIDEEGVEAAAVTTISVARNVMVFEVQRPFILLLWNEARGYPLFLGRVLDPSQ